MHNPTEVELPDNNPRGEATFVASAGIVYINPILRGGFSTSPRRPDRIGYESGSNVSLGHEDDHYWDCGLQCTHLGANQHSGLQLGACADNIRSDFLRHTTTNIGYPEGRKPALNRHQTSRQDSTLTFPIPGLAVEGVPVTILPFLVQPPVS